MRKITMIMLIASLLIIGIFVTVFADSVTTVKMVFWPGPEAEAMQKVVDYYNTNITPESGVKVEMVLFGREGFFEKEATILAGGSSEVDMIFTTSYIIEQHAPYFESLDEYYANSALAGEGKKELFINSVTQGFTIDGKLYTVPTDASITILLYRKDLIEKLISDAEWREKYVALAKKELGKDLEPKYPANWNWDDFYATCLFFTKDYNSDSPTKYGTALQAKAMWPNAKVWTAVVRSCNGSWFDKEGVPTFDSPEALEALNMYVNLMKKGAASPGSVNYEYNEPNEAMKTGNAAMILQWGVAFNELSNKEGAPLIWDRVAIAPYPAGSFGHTCWLTSMGVGLSKYSKFKDESFKWLAFLSTPTAMSLYGKNGGVPPVTQVLEELGQKDVLFKYVEEYLKNYAFNYSGRSGVKTLDILRILSTNISAACALSVSSEEALKDTQNQVNQLLK